MLYLQIVQHACGSDCKPLLKSVTMIAANPLVSHAVGGLDIFMPVHFDLLAE